jgi:hypothetical protein
VGGRERTSLPDFLFRGAANAIFNSLTGTPKVKKNLKLKPHSRLRGTEIEEQGFSLFFFFFLPFFFFSLFLDDGFRNQHKRAI